MHSPAPASALFQRLISRIDINSSSYFIYFHFISCHFVFFSGWFFLYRDLATFFYQLKLFPGRRLLGIENADGKTPNDLASNEMRAALSDVKQCSEIQSSLIAGVKHELPEDGRLQFMLCSMYIVSVL